MDVGNIVFFSLPYATGVSVNLPPFSGGPELCEAHEKMEPMADYCVWMDDFIPTRSQQKHLIESLLWHLHSEGVCCTVSGLFLGHLAGSSNKSSLLAYISLYIERPNLTL